MAENNKSHGLFIHAETMQRSLLDLFASPRIVHTWLRTPDIYHKRIHNKVQSCLGQSMFIHFQC